MWLLIIKRVLIVDQILDEDLIYFLNLLSRHHHYQKHEILVQQGLNLLFILIVEYTMSPIDGDIRYMHTRGRFRSVYRLWVKMMINSFHFRPRLSYVEYLLIF